MSNTTIETKRNIAKKFLLSAPPGQFQQTLVDLQAIFDNDNQSSLSRDFVNEVQKEYNSNTGRNVLLKQTEDSNSNDHHINDDDDFGKSLKDSFQNYVDKHYKGKDVESNFCVVNTTTATTQTNEKNLGSYEIMIYAERIKLKQFHAGSWFTKYTISNTASDDANHGKYIIDGVAILRGNSFENGNINVKSNITLPSKRIQTSSSASSLEEEIINVIQSWDEEYILRPLKGMYDDLSSNVLKKIRRIMPVTRTKFDWNLSGHRFVRAMEKDVQN